MKLFKLIEKLNEKFPENICEPWDNVGLLAGDKNMEIKKVLLSLDVDSNTVDEAINQGVNLIISHHPLIFRPLKRITNDDIIGSRIIKIIQNNIAIYAMHTNLDSSLGGLNDYVFKKMNIDAKRIYITETTNMPLRYYELNKELKLEEVINIIKKNLNIQNLRVISRNFHKNIRRFALVTGSGMDFFNNVKDKVDLFITADIKYHEAQDALEYGIDMIDFGHLESEIYFVNLLEEYLMENTDLEISKYYVEKIFKFI